MSRSVSVLLPIVPTRAEQAAPFAAFVQWRGARALWQGQALLNEQHQIMAQLSGLGMRVPFGLGVSLMPLRHPVQAAIEARTLAAASGQLPGGLHRWHRRPGPACPAPFHTLTAPLRALVPHTYDFHGTQAATGEAAPDGSREYTASGPYSLAHVLMAGGGPHAAPGGRHAVEHILHGTGALLASLHRQPVTPEVRRPSRGIARLHAWLSGATAAGGADAVALLGSAAVAPLTAWAAEAVTHADAHVLSHGAPGLGSLVPSPAGDRAVLLTGEDICAAPRHLDVGWLTGELVELRWLLGRAADPGAWQALVDAFLDGYGGEAASGGHHRRGTALRVALHAHDSAAYVAQGKGPAALYGVLAARLTAEAVS